MSNSGIWQQALELFAAGVVADVTRVADDTGTDRLVRLDFMTDGDYLIAGEEDFEGEPAGFSYTLYDREGQDFATDGDPDLAAFSAEVRRIAGGRD
jgi:hypothetical protein